MGTYPATGGKPNFLEFMSPIGDIVHCYHEEPQLKTVFNTKTPLLDDNGIQLAEYKVTMAWDKRLMDMRENNAIPGTAGLVPMRELAFQAKTEAWPESLDPQKGHWIVLEPFLRDGDNPQHNTERKEYLFGKVYLNIKQKAKPEKVMVNGQPTGRIVYTGKPGLTGPYNEDLLSTDVYAGCKGRVSGILYGTEYAGKKFISVRLNNIQKYMDGERLQGGARKSARDQFDPLMQGLPPIQPMNGFGQPQQGGFAAQQAMTAPYGQGQPQQGYQLAAAPAHVYQQQPMADPFARPGGGGMRML